STILGLGAFIFFTRLFFASRTKIIFLINLFMLLMVSYRGLITFSRVGMITCAVMVVILIFVTYVKISSRARGKLNIMLVLFTVAVFGLWTYSSLETGGLIEKRYANQDATGRVKKSQFTGREEISKP